MVTFCFHTGLWERSFIQKKQSYGWQQQHKWNRHYTIVSIFKKQQTNKQTTKNKHGSDHKLCFFSRMWTSSNSSMNITENPPEGASFIELAQEFILYKIAEVIDKWWFIFFTPICFLGNTLSTAVMTMKHNRHLSTCTYMMAISINDNIVMLILLYQWLLKNTEIQILTDLVCKILGSSLFIFVYNGTYQVMLMTFDKCFAIILPHKSLSFCTPQRARLLLLIAFITMVIFNSPHFYLTKFVISDCSAYAIKGKLVTVYLYLSFIVTSIVPFLSLVIMNFIIIRAVKKSRQLRHQNTDSNNTDFKKGKQVENQLTIMCIVIAATFVTLFLPSYIRFIVYQVIVPTSSPKTFAGFYFFVHVSFRLYATNYGLHFFLYLLSGTKFRNDLRKLLGFKDKKKNRPGYHGDLSVNTSQTSVSMETGPDKTKIISKQETKYWRSCLNLAAILLINFLYGSVSGRNHEVLNISYICTTWNTFALVLKILSFEQLIQMFAML